MDRQTAKVINTRETDRDLLRMLARRLDFARRAEKTTRITQEETVTFAQALRRYLDDCYDSPEAGHIAMRDMTHLA